MVMPFDLDSNVIVMGTKQGHCSEGKALTPLHLNMPNML